MSIEHIALASGKSCLSVLSRLLCVDNMIE